MMMMRMRRPAMAAILALAAMAGGYSLAGPCTSEACGHPWPNAPTYVSTGCFAGTWDATYSGRASWDTTSGTAGFDTPIEVELWLVNDNTSTAIAYSDFGNELGCGTGYGCVSNPFTWNPTATTDNAPNCPCTAGGSYYTKMVQCADWTTVSNEYLSIDTVDSSPSSP